MQYKHRQIGYVMITVTLAVLILFAWMYITTANEPAGIDAGNNLVATTTMIVIMFILTAFTSLQVTIDKKQLGIKFGYGIYKKTFSLDEITVVKTAKNPRYTGWGIRRRLWPKMWIYTVSGFDAVEIRLKNGKKYRIGTDEPKTLEQAILHAIKEIKK